jgi:hypothetical protein
MVILREPGVGGTGGRVYQIVKKFVPIVASYCRRVYGYTNIEMSDLQVVHCR